MHAQVVLVVMFAVATAAIVFALVSASRANSRESALYEAFPDIGEYMERELETARAEHEQNVQTRDDRLKAYEAAKAKAEKSGEDVGRKQAALTRWQGRQRPAAAQQTPDSKEEAVKA